MNKILLTSLILVIMSVGNTSNAQNTTRQNWTAEKAQTWFNRGDWMNGIAPQPHPSINVQELAYQYHKNKALWEKAFDFIRKTDLDTIAPGRYILEGDDLYVSIAEGPLKSMEEAKWEAHKKYIDIQYVIRGKEKMGIIPIQKVTPLDAFDIEKDLGFYTAEEKEAKYYEASPSTFLIFFPADAHRPSLKVPGFESDKKLVVKIKAD